MKRVTGLGLGQTKEPTAVQPYIRRLFTGTREAQFTDAELGTVILGIVSSDGEKMDFRAPVTENVTALIATF